MSNLHSQVHLTAVCSSFRTLAFAAILHLWRDRVVICVNLLKEELQKRIAEEQLNNNLSVEILSTAVGETVLVGNSQALKEPGTVSTGFLAVFLFLSCITKNFSRRDRWRSECVKPRLPGLTLATAGSPACFSGENISPGGPGSNMWLKYWRLALFLLATVYNSLCRLSLRSRLEAARGIFNSKVYLECFHGYLRFWGLPALVCCSGTIPTAV